MPHVAADDYCPPIAGASAPALRRAHLQRLMAYSLSILVCTTVAWEAVLSSWSARAGPGRIFGDFLSLMVRRCQVLSSADYLDLGASSVYVLQQERYSSEV